ncbi:NAD-dependent epimerase/dehydratase family protein [Asanoa iriomotensis]|uniref:NAD(P)-dependent oxidoreductase n=1 Tax=Asanoa iriomotensis TaxID=234613 RepID=A0ABQ4C987_9ACTN|nr:NAD(P)-dependent oxidoreductase [Asanoa iriomotensis]GIF59322.1 NAD(P)-dependent oxidoreductase [Asanoa iriomotensis]
MRVLLAGATGAIGTPLIQRLVAYRHEVIGITRLLANARRLEAFGAKYLVADVLDREGLLRAVSGIRADAVIHECTSLTRPPLRYQDLDKTNALRTTGTANLVEAARAVGAKRFLSQSIVYGYGYGDHGAKELTEADPFGVPADGPLGPIMDAFHEAEAQATNSDGLEGVSLRYGLFYGSDPGTKRMIHAVSKRRLPVIRGGGGEQNMIHLDDAASATVAALEKGKPGNAYNVVDGVPVTWGDLLDEMAGLVDAKPPVRVPSPVLKLAAPYGYTAMTTSMRVSNEKARTELDWTPAVVDYKQGLRMIATE